MLDGVIHVNHLRRGIQDRSARILEPNDRAVQAGRGVRDGDIGRVDAVRSVVHRTIAVEVEFYCRGTAAQTFRDEVNVSGSNALIRIQVQAKGGIADAGDGSGGCSALTILGGKPYRQAVQARLQPNVVYEEMSVRGDASDDSIDADRRVRRRLYCPRNQNDGVIDRGAIDSRI